MYTIKQKYSENWWHFELTGDKKRRWFLGSYQRATLFTTKEVAQAFVDKLQLRDVVIRKFRKVS